jgi:glutamate-ammonia-ligase adenylyltransferase
VTSPEDLGRALAAAPDPHLARVALSRVDERPAAREALEDPDVLEAAARVLGFSTAVADLLVAHPEETRTLADLHPRTPDELGAELATDVARHGPEDGLRRFRRRALLRVAARDLAGAGVDEVTAEITAVAEACLEEACRRVAPGGGLAVIGLGKLGGAELNYSSDVDVLFLNVPAGSESQAGPERAAARLIRLLAEPTGEGVALRVDANLRPGGRSGSLSRSLGATVEHYLRFAASWERQALLKARPVAGDRDLGAAFLERVAPVVYPSDLAAGTIEDVRATKVRIEEYVRAAGKEAVEVKRGRGGIRDVEFAVQLLQLVHGRRDERLREPNTLRALGVLADQGYVAEADAEELAEAYRFLRRLEHRLQIVRDLQTHELPTDRAALGVLARSMGLPSATALAAEHERRTAQVRGLHERLFYRPLLEAFAGPATPRPGVEREATIELLAGLGFRRPEAAYDALDRLVDPGSRLGRVLAHVFPVIAPALALAGNPDAALLRLERVLEGAADPAVVADRMASDPRTARTLAHAVAASSFATDLLAARPELLEGLGEGVGLDDDVGGDPDLGLLQTAAAYAARDLEPKEVGGRLADVADAVIRRAVADADPDLPFAAIGLGKLGGRELNFASDLDLVFVYEGEGSAAFERANRAAERVLARIREAGWEPDADLRPEGRAGPLARSLAAFLEYWERWAEPWEFQALLRSRHVAGDRGLGRRFESLAEDLAYPEVLTIDRVAEMRRMRERIERERVRPREALRFHFKLGYGSLADVQFAVELSLMRHGGGRAEVRRRGTLEAVEALAQVRLIEDSVALALAEAFVFLNDVKNALEVDRRVHAEAVPPGPLEQLALARRLGYEEHPRQTFLEDYRRVTRRARRAMERVFAEVAEVEEA